MPQKHQQGNPKREELQIKVHNQRTGRVLLGSAWLSAVGMTLQAAGKERQHLATK